MRRLSMGRASGMPGTSRSSGSPRAFDSCRRRSTRCASGGSTAPTGRVAAHRSDRAAHRRRQPAADRLAGRGRAPVLRGDDGRTDGRTQAPAPTPRRPQCRRRQRRDPRRLRRRRPWTSSGTGRSSRPEHGADRADARGRGDPSGRAGRDRTVSASRRHGRRRRSRHRQDHRRPAPRGLRAVRLPVDRRPRCARLRAEPAVPHLHLRGAALARRERRTAGDHVRSGGRRGDADRAGPRRADQGPRGARRRASPVGAEPPAPRRTAGAEDHP